VFQPHVILHPTDFSESSTYAFCVAVDLAQQNQARLLVLHAVETLGPENVSYGEAVSQLQPESYDRRLWDDLRRVAPAADSGLAVQHLLVEGEPARVIECAAREHRVDLIVMGTHGRTGVRRLLMGSVAERVVRLANCPVLVVKAPVSDKTAPS